MTCAQCGKSFESKRKDAKFCSPKCRVTFNRNKKEPVSVTEPESVTDNVTDNTPPPVTDKPVYRDGTPMTETDALFNAHWDNYIFALPKAVERTCVQCGKEFSTRLAMNRYCSPLCKDITISSLTV